MRVAIVGAGIMGRLLAWELSKAGYRPELFDRDGAETGTAASYTAAGMLAPCSELESAETRIYRMGMQGLGLWAQLASELGDIGFRNTGTLVVAHPGERGELQRFHQRLQHRLGTAAGPMLDRGQLSRLEPALAERFHEALYLSQEACVDNCKVMMALTDRLLRAEVPWHAHTGVLRLAPGRLDLPQRSLTFDWVLDCRGLGARDDIAGLRGVRGELLEVSAPGVHMEHMVRMMHPRYRVYLVPAGAGRYLIGATQIESDDSSPISVRSALELLSALYSLHEGFSEARITGMRSNCRPALIDNLPVIMFQPGLLRINGLFRHGFLLAPVLARQVLQFLEAGSAEGLAWADVFRQDRRRALAEVHE